MQTTTARKPSLVHVGQFCLSLWVLLLLTAGCAPAAKVATPGQEPGKLVLFAAASLTDALSVLAADFVAQNPAYRMTTSFAGSQQLAQQLVQGAPADLFASADPVQMQTVVDAGLVDPAAVRFIASNTLLIALPSDNPAAIRSLADLARPGLKLVLAAPAVPAGRYSQTMLSNANGRPGYPADFSTRVSRNVVSYEQSVRAVLSKVLLGEADAGIVYTTDATSVEASRLQSVTIDAAINGSTRYSLAPLKASDQATGAAAFVDFVLSEHGQSVLRSFGFNPPDGP